MSRRLTGLLLLGILLAMLATMALACDSPPTQTPTSSVTSTPLPQVTPTETPTLTQLDTPTPLPTLAPPAPITATSNGYTVTLYPVSADASRVLITYTLTAPPGHNPAATYLANGISQYWDLDGPSLSVGGGTSLQPRSMNTSFSEFDERTDPAAPQFPSSSTKAIAFDRTRRENDISTLNLHLEGDLVAVKTEAHTGSVFIDPVVETVARGLFFDFTLPVSRYRRTTDINQTSHAGGIALTLERIAVTPSETLLFMHGSNDPNPNAYWTQDDLLPDDIQISTGDGQVSTTKQAGGYPLVGFHLQQAGNHHWILYYPSNPLQSNNQWTVTIGQVTNAHAHTDNPIGIQGPWIFHFTLPDPVEDSAPLVTP